MLFRSLGTGTEVGTLGAGTEAGTLRTGTEAGTLGAGTEAGTLRTGTEAGTLGAGTEARTLGAGTEAGTLGAAGRHKTGIGHHLFGRRLSRRRRLGERGPFGQGRLEGLLGGLSRLLLHGCHLLRTWSLACWTATWTAFRAAGFRPGPLGPPRLSLAGR